MDSSKLMKIRGSSGGGWWATLLLDGLLLVWLPPFILSRAEQNAHVRPAGNLKEESVTLWKWRFVSLRFKAGGGLQKQIWGSKLQEAFSQSLSHCSWNTFTPRDCMRERGRDHLMTFPYPQNHCGLSLRERIPPAACGMRLSGTKKKERIKA